MRVWRLCKAKYAPEAFSGEGARLAGGRWNHPGHSVVYTSESRALAILEHRVHSPQLVPNLVLIPAELPDAAPVSALQSAHLPPEWNTYPAPEELRQLGADWLAKGESLALIVPSAVIPGERNILLNPRHAAFRALRIYPPEPFNYDRRLF